MPIRLNHSNFRLAQITRFARVVRIDSTNHATKFFKEKKQSENPRAHKNKIGTSPPPQNPKYPAQNPKRGILWTWDLPAERTLFPGVHKIGAAFSGPRIADKNFTDTRIFLKQGKCAEKRLDYQILLLKSGISRHNRLTEYKRGRQEAIREPKMAQKKFSVSP